MSNAGKRGTMIVAPKDDHLRCHKHCPGGHRCLLSSSVPHRIHCCGITLCYCHSPQRYGRESWVEAEDAYGRPQP